MSADLKYRPDIDGLRAIAVLGVVLYHFDIGPIKGGFVGVDIFFVISGYLITAIIQGEVSRGQFTFLGFYERRIRRIFPALFAVLVVTLIAGVAVLLPSDLVRLGHASLATLLFVSNILFWRQSGYFDTSSEYNPLLHTWSLAVEEQFYIGLPILLLIVHRFGSRWLKSVLVACVLVSLAVCVSLQAGHPSATFFLSPFRAWELLFGSLIAVGSFPRLQNRWIREALSLGALWTLLGSLCLIQAGPSFPGLWAVPPVLATATLLYTGGEGDCLVSRMLRWHPLVYIGIISYSLYLWHWPLLTFARYANGMESIGSIQSWLLVGVALLVAAGSYRYVETPFRKRRTEAALPATRRQLFAGATVIAVLLAGASMSVTAGKGLIHRFEADALAFDRARSPFIPYKNDCDGRPPDQANRKCSIGDPSSSRLVLIWGDSHALAWAPGLDAYLEELGLRGVLAVNSACPPLIGIHNPSDPDCFSANEGTFRWTEKNNPEVTIMIAAWGGYSSPDGRYSIFDDEGHEGNTSTFPLALQRTVSALGRLSQRIILIGPTPGAPQDIPFKLAISAAVPPAEISEQEFRSGASWFWRAASGVRTGAELELVDPSPWFCGGGGGCKYLDDDGRLLYRDGGHLSLVGARFAAERLSWVLYPDETNPSPKMVLP